jgi:hypothetical protein
MMPFNEGFHDPVRGSFRQSFRVGRVKIAGVR